MSSDSRRGSENALAKALRDLQVRLEDGVPKLSSNASALYDSIARMLRRAVLEEVLRNGLYDVAELLRLTESSRDARGTWFVLTGGPKEFTRLTSDSPTSERFVRDDGAVIHFYLTLLERPGGTLEVDVYHFEIYFPSREPISFIRFDLNRRGHGNETRGLRAHLHPGNEDLQLPSPHLSPLDTLAFLIYRCRLEREAGRS